MSATDAATVPDIINHLENDNVIKDKDNSQKQI